MLKNDVLTTPYHHPHGVIQTSYFINAAFYPELLIKRRWQFIGHILRQQPDNDCVTAPTWQSWREECTAAQDRNRWRAHVDALCANLAPGDK